MRRSTLMVELRTLLLLSTVVIIYMTTVRNILYNIFGVQNYRTRSHLVEWQSLRIPA